MVAEPISSSATKVLDVFVPYCTAIFCFWIGGFVCIESLKSRCWTASELSTPLRPSNQAMNYFLPKAPEKSGIDNGRLAIKVKIETG